MSAAPYVCGHARQHSYLVSTSPKAMCPACYMAKLSERAQQAQARRIEQRRAQA